MNKQPPTTPSAPSKPAATTKPAATKPVAVSASSTPAKPGPTSSAPAKPTGVSSSAAPKPASHRSGSAESGEAEADAAQRRKKDSWMQTHWKEFSARADKNPSYLVVFDHSPVEVRDAVVKDILGGTEPKLSAMTCHMSFLDTALGKPDLGSVQVATMEAEDFSALSDEFETYTITVVKSKGQPKRTAFVPVKARPHQAPTRD